MSSIKSKDVRWGKPLNRCCRRSNSVKLQSMDAWLLLFVFFLVKESPPKVSQAEIGWTPRNNPKETTSAGLGQPKNPSGGIFLFILLWFRVFSDPKNFTALIGEVKILHQDFSIQHSNKINTCSWICWCISWFLPEQNPKRRGEDLAQQAEIGRFTYLGVPPPPRPQPAVWPRQWSWCSLY